MFTSFDIRSNERPTQNLSFSAASVIVGFVKPIIQICLFNHEFQEKLSVISFDTISRAGDFNVLIEKIRLLSPWYFFINLISLIYIIGYYFTLKTLWTHYADLFYELPFITAGKDTVR